MSFDRRKFLQYGASGLLAASLAGAPGLSFASAPTNKRLIVIILRGGMDGLAAVPAMGDKYYKTARGAIALNDALPLDGFFAMHPALAPLHEMYQEKEMAIFHGIASPYRKRSHFDAQNLLENGTSAPNGARDGWLNRVLSLMPARENSSGLAIGQNIPFILYGKQPVASWAPSRKGLPDDAFLEQVSQLYDTDSMFHMAFTQGVAIHDIADMALKDMKKQKEKKNNQIGVFADAASRLLKEDKGARIATIEISGWDTHAKQGTEKGNLANNLKNLAQGIAGFKKYLSPIWKDTAIMVVTEFGRTVSINGTGGTDHGTASTAFLIGGAVKGGKIHADWNGLGKDQLYQNRDLMPTSDLRQLFKGVLHDHLGTSSRHLDNTIFPDSRQARKFEKLIHI